MIQERRRWTLRSSVRVAAFAAILAACQSGPSGSLSSGTPAPSVSPSPTSPASPLASSSAASPTGSSSLAPSPASGWMRYPVQTGLGATLTRVVWTGSRFLAVAGPDGTLLDSTDGRTWHQQPRIADGDYVDLVAAASDGMLAVGSVNVEGVIAIWRSTDGLEWSPVPDATSLHSRDGAFITMAAIVATDDGWLAVGSEHLNCIPGACGLVRAVVWVSPDGVRWTRAPDATALQHAGMTGVVRTPSGYVAVGEAAEDPSHPTSAVRPAVWTSSDGRTWTRSGRLPAVKAAKNADVILDSVAATGSRVVVVGHVETPGTASDAFTWWSDGATWSSIRLRQFLHSQDIRVAAVPGGYLAMYGVGSDPECPSAVWSSADGSSWSCIGNDPAFADSTVTDVAISPDVEVLVGHRLDAAAVWISAPH